MEHIFTRKVHKAAAHFEITRDEFGTGGICTFNVGLQLRRAELFLDLTLLRTL